MHWAWMLWSPYALGTPTEVCFGPGCSGHRMLLEHERNYALGMVLWSPYALGTPTEVCFGHGCSGHSMLLEHERNYVLGMDALVTVCSWNTNGIMLWAWMLWSPYALGTQTEVCIGHGCSGHRMLLYHEGNLCFGHGCSGHRMLLEHERNYALGMDALVTVSSWNMNGINALGMDALVTVCSSTRTESQQM